MRETVDNVVIGGGPAGSMLAMRLAHAGREVVLLERERQAHDKVCGEFLSREAVAYLRQAGIDPQALGARAIRSVRLHVGKTSIETKLPFPALSLSRRCLDECLLTAAKSAGCEVRSGTFVESVQRTIEQWSISLRGDQTLNASAVFLATGKHDLRGFERGRGAQNDLVGFKLHLELNAAQLEQLRGNMELFLFSGGYGGLTLVENDAANLCLVVQRNRLTNVGGWPNLLASIRRELPALNERLRESTANSTKPLAISPIPYGHLGTGSDSLWRLGDQIAVIPSFTGDGMSIAMHSAALAAEMFLAGETPDAYARRLTSQLRPSMRFASFLSRAMVTSPGRTVAPTLLQLLPRAMKWIAALTRIPERALLTNGAAVPSAESTPSSRFV